MTSVAFQSNLRKQIRKLPKILKLVKIIQYYSILFNRVLRFEALGVRAGIRPRWRRDAERRRDGRVPVAVPLQRGRRGVHSHRSNRPAERWVCGPAADAAAHDDGGTDAIATHDDDDAGPFSSQN